MLDDLFHLEHGFIQNFISGCHAKIMDGILLANGFINHIWFQLGPMSLLSDIRLDLNFIGVGLHTSRQWTWSNPPGEGFVGRMRGGSLKPYAVSSFEVTWLKPICIQNLRGFLMEEVQRIGHLLIHFLLMIKEIQSVLTFTLNGQLNAQN